MNITQDHKKEIEDIIKNMQDQGIKCLKDFNCYKSSFEELCSIKGIGSFGNIECYSEDARCCKLSFSAFGKNFCECPLRRYIAKNFHR